MDILAFQTLLWYRHFWVWKELIYCGDKFGDFQQKVGDFLVRTSGHSEHKLEAIKGRKWKDNDKESKRNAKSCGKVSKDRIG